MECCLPARGWSEGRLRCVLRSQGDPRSPGASPAPDTTTAPGPELGGRRRERLVQVVAQDLRARRVAQLRHRLRLDLTDALARHAVDLADLVEGARLAVGEAEAQADHAGLA